MTTRTSSNMLQSWPMPLEVLYLLIRFELCPTWQLECSSCITQVVYQYSRKSEILQLLEEHITENIVKVGPYYLHLLYIYDSHCEDRIELLPPKRWYPARICAVYDLVFLLLR